MTDLYILALETVYKKYGKNDKLYPIYVVGLYSLLCRFSRFKNLVIRTFLETDIFFETGSIEDILRRHNKSVENIGGLNKDEAYPAYAVSNLGNEVEFDEDTLGVKAIYNTPYIASSIDNVPYEILLNSFCHELSHIIKGQIKPFQIICREKDYVEFYFRNGLSNNIFYTEDKTLYNSLEFSVLDEVVNVLHTSDAIREIDGLSEFVANGDIKEFISGLDPTLLYKDCGYEECVEIFRDLWNNERFKSLVDSSSICGDDKLELSFLAIGEDAYEKLGYLLDKLFDLSLLDTVDSEKDKVKEEIKTIIDAYNKKYKDNVLKK